MAFIKFTTDKFITVKETINLLVIEPNFCRCCTACLESSSTDAIDPSYANMVCQRINQFTDYQWQVHVVSLLPHSLLCQDNKMFEKTVV